jgi:phosphoribosylamine-glycine ligase
MSPRDFLDQLTKLVAAGRDPEAVEFSCRFGPEVLPLLAATDLDIAYGLMKSARLNAELAEVESRDPAAVGD